jgi:hypothetical protein
LGIEQKLEMQPLSDRQMQAFVAACSLFAGAVGGDAAAVAGAIAGVGEYAVAVVDVV